MRRALVLVCLLTGCADWDGVRMDGTRVEWGDEVTVPHGIATSAELAPIRSRGQARGFESVVLQSLEPSTARALPSAYDAVVYLTGESPGVAEIEVEIRGRWTATERIEPPFLSR